MTLGDPRDLGLLRWKKKKMQEKRLKNSMAKILWKKLLKYLKQDLNRSGAGSTEVEAMVEVTAEVGVQGEAGDRSIGDKGQ